jgi:triosephosphate isomerase
VNYADPNTEVVIAPPTLYLLLAREHLDPAIEVAAQNVFDRPNGAFTGEISVEQLKDSGITWTLLGHSERRTILREEDQFIAKKTLTAVTGGIGVILCCGESLEEREKGATVEVVTKQLEAVNKAIEKDHWKQIVIAYEPIWAIGTGKVATTGKHIMSKPPPGLTYPLKPSLSSGTGFGELTVEPYRTSTRGARSHQTMA